MNTTIHGSIAAARPIAAAIRTAGLQVRPEPHLEHPATPFVTISREAGAGGWALAQNLAEHLNTVDPGEKPWTAWDRELVEKVAADHRISAALIESLEDRGQSWFEEFLGGLKFASHQPTEMEVYFRTATTIRALAEMGRAVIVGRGGAFVTAGMPGGIHIRLIAPIEHRIRFMGKSMSLDHAAAAAKVRELDHNRAAFYKRYWPGKALTPDAFTMTINTASIDEIRLVQCVASLVPMTAHQGNLAVGAA